MAADDWGTLFRMLAEQQRRRVLVRLLNDEELAAEPGVANADASPRAKTRQLKVHHLHLPQLEAAGYIMWNRDRNTVERGPEFETIRPILELLDEHADDILDGWT